MTQKFTPSAPFQTARWVITAVVVVICLLAFWEIRNILLLLLTSIVLVVLITTPMRFLTRKGVDRRLATVISLLTIPVFFLVLTLTVLPLLATQFGTLSRLVEAGFFRLQESWQALSATPPQYFLGWDYPILGLTIPRDPLLEAASTFINSFQFNAELITQVANQIFNAFGQFGVTVIPVVGGVASVFLNGLIVIFMSMYLLTDPKGHEDGLIRLLPMHYRKRGREIMDRLDLAMRGWLESTLLAMVFVGIATWIGLTVLGLDEALALGVIAGLLAFVPTFGTLIAVILAVAVGVLQQPQNVGWIIIVTYAISLVQSQVISPLLVAGRINIPPIMVLLGQIIAAVFFGFMGILLAVPLTAILLVLIEEIYVRDILGDRPQVAESAEIAQPKTVLTEDKLAKGET
ncbi:MAG: AI-2E family transporter [Anaerolineae bacterium]|nr:AI-2E family transporter [Anaerolineae bacterium]